MSRSSKSAATLESRVQAITHRAQLLSELASSEHVAELAARHQRAVESSRRAAGAVRRAEAERVRATSELSQVREAMRQQVIAWRDRGVSLADLGAALGMDSSALRTLIGDRHAAGTGGKRGRGRPRAQHLPLVDPEPIEAELVDDLTDQPVDEADILDADVVDSTISTSEPASAWG